MTPILHFQFSCCIQFYLLSVCNRSKPHTIVRRSTTRQVFPLISRKFLTSAKVRRTMQFDAGIAPMLPTNNHILFRGFSIPLIWLYSTLKLCVVGRSFRQTLAPNVREHLSFKGWQKEKPRNFWGNLDLRSPFELPLVLWNPVTSQYSWQKFKSCKNMGQYLSFQYQMKPSLFFSRFGRLSSKTPQPNNRSSWKPRWNVPSCPGLDHLPSCHQTRSLRWRREAPRFELSSTQLWRRSCRHFARKRYRCRL